MTSFLWHKVSEQEREQIKKQAKEIMDNFSRKLDKLGEIEESFIERDEFERKENNKGSLKLDTLKGTSREIFFENAPSKNKDFIVAEKGGWKE